MLTKEKPAKRQPSAGILLTIPSDHPGTFVSKDLAECTNEEFLSWAQFCYGGTVTADASRFESVANRMKAFNQICTYHLGMLTKGQKAALN